ncbi:TetR/AcrR family transcriptional regulator [Hyphomicrobium facile]|uniref:TetR/AcrR family transcriptional regulator n=1 Tax=Hyphomicrobium facile TaxID=51670 RepID=UPI0011608857|nr:TetR/AcrR family transcriptional regulator [Hyphomicrobium facile]
MSAESSSPVAARKRRKQAAKRRSQRRVVRAGRPRLDVASPDTEMKICAVALDLFADRGFSSVTTKDIADATGFNPALIYYYFGSKDELFRRAVTLAVERAFEQFRLAREGLEHPRDIIYGWLDIHVKEYRTISKLIMIAIDYAKTSKRNVRIDEAIRRFYLDERDVLKAALASGVARGDFRNVDVEETANFISTFLDGVCARAMILKDFDPIVAIGELRSFLNTHLKRKK